MSQELAPRPLICVGRLRDMAINLEQSLAPHFRFAAIVDLDNYSAQAVRILLATLNLYPAGVFVGGGVSLEIQQEVEQIVLAHNASKPYSLKLVSVPVGIRDRVGPEEYVDWIRNALSKEFDLTW